MTQAETVPLVADEQRRDVMKAPDEVSAMLRLKALGWGSKRIAAESSVPIRCELDLGRRRIMSSGKLGTAVGGGN